MKIGLETAKTCTPENVGTVVNILPLTVTELDIHLG